MVSTSLTINMNALILTEVFPSDLFVWMQDKRLLSNKKGWIKQRIG